MLPLSPSVMQLLSVSHLTRRYHPLLLISFPPCVCRVWLFLPFASPWFWTKTVGARRYERGPVEPNPDLYRGWHEIRPTVSHSRGCCEGAYQLPRFHPEQLRSTARAWCYYAGMYVYSLWGLLPYYNLYGSEITKGSVIIIAIEAYVFRYCGSGRCGIWGG